MRARFHNDGTLGGTGYRFRIDRRGSVFLLIFLLQPPTPALAWQIGPGSELDAKLGSRVEQYSLDAESFLSGLLTLANDFHIPMGIEWKKERPGTSSRYTRTWREVPVRTILQDLVNSQPEYDLDSNSGVAHIRLAAMRNDPGDILDARVPQFEVRDEYVGVASRRLQSVANAIMIPPEPLAAVGGSGGSIGTGSGDRKLSFRLQGAAVREILDRMCLMSELKVWIIRYPDPPTRTAAGFVRTTTVMQDLSVDDKFQPTWVLLEWGRSLDRK